MISHDLDDLAHGQRERNVLNFDVLATQLTVDLEHLHQRQEAVVKALHALGLIFNGQGAPDRSDALKTLYDTRQKQPRVLAQAFEIAAATLTAVADKQGVQPRA